MSFSSLPAYTQDIIMVQFEFFAKIFILGFLFVVAIVFMDWYKKNKIKGGEESPYLLLDLARQWMYYLSWVYTYLTPLFILWLYPQQGMDGLLKGLFTVYRLSYWLIGMLLIANIFWYGAHLIARISGIYVFRSKKADKVLDQILGKHKNLFKRT